MTKTMIKILLTLIFVVVASSAHAAITWGNFYFDGVLTTTNSVVDATPLISISATSAPAPTYNAWTVLVDGVAQPIVPPNPSYSAPTFSYQINTAMSVGAHQIVILGLDIAPTSAITINITVQAQAQQLVGSVAPYPSPAISNINFQYSLLQ
jgi:hypothetical protein